MTESQQSPAFSFRAQTLQGQAISGTIDAGDQQQAASFLQSLQLRILQLNPARRRGGGGAIGGEDFLAFNQQLAHLTSAALPIEQGLRFIAHEMQPGVMREAIERAVGEMDRGKTLAEAVEAQRDRFPPAYSRLIDAGIRTANLPDILLNLSRHLLLMRRLQAVIRQTLAYPAVVMMVFIVILLFILTVVAPEFEEVLKTLWIQPPVMTELVIGLSRAVSPWPVWSSILVAMLATVLLLRELLHRSVRGSARAERWVLRIPLIGAILKRSLICRWCDAVGVGVDAGLDLPASIQVASDATGSAALAADGRALSDVISSGRPIGAAPPGRLLPPTVIAALDLGSARSDLAQTLRTLARMYQQQAQLRLASYQAVVTPALLVSMGIMVGLLMLVLLSPLIAMINAMGGGHW
jgi:type II secretory pathway component PulF